MEWQNAFGVPVGLEILESVENVAMTSDDAQSLSFEDSFRQLAEIAEGMEKGGLTLAEATARFEQGMKLVQRCNYLLDTAELEITQLRANYQRPGVSAGHTNDSEPSFDYPADDGELYEDEDSLPF